METNTSAMQPIAPKQGFITLLDPASWDYILSNDIFVSPVVDNVT